MASQIVSDSTSGASSYTEIVSYVYVVIMNTKKFGSQLWGEEPTNVSDRLAVCIQKDGQIVGHIPRNLAPLIYCFLIQETSTRVRQRSLNHDAGMGMEVPCIYRQYGPEVYITRLQDMVKKDINSMKLRYQL